MKQLRIIYMIFLGRLREFYRDRDSLYWNLVFPFFIIISFYAIFNNQDAPLYKVGVVGELTNEIKNQESFFNLNYVQFIPQSEESTLEESIHKVRNYKLDMLIQMGTPLKYWIHPSNKKSYFMEKWLNSSFLQPVEKKVIKGQVMTYVDWVFPGIVALNLMFSCLWGVGWLIVKYRDEEYLKRLNASPLKVYQFLLGQTLSRLLIVFMVTHFIIILGGWMIDFKIQGSYFDLLVCYFLGTLSLISIGLLVSSRTTNKEFADGVLNLFSWPMIVFSGMWFSLEGTHEWIQNFSYLLPLTHIIESTREIMLEGAQLAQVSDHLVFLALFTLCFYGTVILIFKWNER